MEAGRLAADRLMPEGKEGGPSAASPRLRQRYPLVFSSGARAALLLPHSYRLSVADTCKLFISGVLDTRAVEALPHLRRQAHQEATTMTRPRPGSGTNCGPGRPRGFRGEVRDMIRTIGRGVLGALLLSAAAGHSPALAATVDRQKLQQALNLGQSEGAGSIVVYADGAFAGR